MFLAGSKQIPLTLVAQASKGGTPDAARITRLLAPRGYLGTCVSQLIIPHSSRLFVVSIRGQEN
jgi:hypothetical protein